jgi:hypothetical protein
VQAVLDVEQLFHHGQQGRDEARDRAAEHHDFFAVFFQHNVRWSPYDGRHFIGEAGASPEKGLNLQGRKTVAGRA